MHLYLLKYYIICELQPLFSKRTLDVVSSINNIYNEEKLQQDSRINFSTLFSVRCLSCNIILDSHMHHVVMKNSHWLAVSVLGT